MHAQQKTSSIIMCCFLFCFSTMCHLQQWSQAISAMDAIVKGKGKRLKQSHQCDNAYLNASSSAHVTHKKRTNAHALDKLSQPVPDKKAPNQTTQQNSKLHSIRFCCSLAIKNQTKCKKSISQNSQPSHWEKKRAGHSLTATIKNSYKCSSNARKYAMDYC